MARKARIYTRTGDAGETGIGGGTRVSKDHPRLAAYGTVDELNAILGLLLSHEPQLPEAGLLAELQNDLLDAGADLAWPEDCQEDSRRIKAPQVTRLEEAIDRLSGKLPELRKFILPGGTTLAAWCHLARTVCRRAEREAVALSRAESVNPEVLRYLNRLSDFFFVLARAGNDWGRRDVLWEPGKGAESKPE